MPAHLILGNGRVALGSQAGSSRVPETSGALVAELPPGRSRSRSAVEPTAAPTSVGGSAALPVWVALIISGDGAGAHGACDGRGTCDGHGACDARGACDGRGACDCQAGPRPTICSLETCSLAASRATFSGGPAAATACHRVLAT